MNAVAGQHIGTGPFTLPELAEFLGGQYGTLHSWQKKGIIRPSVRSCEGTGYPSFYSQKDACIVRGLLQLRSGGLDIQGLMIVANRWYEESDAWCPACHSPLPWVEWSHP